MKSRHSTGRWRDGDSDNKKEKGGRIKRGGGKKRRDGGIRSGKQIQRDRQTETERGTWIAVKGKGGG